MARVGRGPQLARLNDAVAAVLDGQFVAVEICGEAGMGKTRMLAELGRRAAAAGLLVCTSRTTQFEQGGAVRRLRRPEPSGDLGEPASRSGTHTGVRRMLAGAPASGAVLLPDDVH